MNPMNAKHTQGPWVAQAAKAGGYGTAPSIAIKAGGPFGPAVCNAGSSVVGRGAEAIANAHLIAAAPDLLEALTHAHALLSALADRNAPGVDAAFRMYDAAIAKARG